MNNIYLHLKARDWLAGCDVTSVSVSVADMAEVKGQLNLCLYISFCILRDIESHAARMARV